MAKPSKLHRRPGRAGWWASVTTTDGRRSYLNFGATKTEAEQQHRAALVLKDKHALTRQVLDDFRKSRRFSAPAPKARTLADAWEDRRQAKSAEAWKSRETDELRWAVLGRYIPHETELRSLTLAQVNGALEAMRRDRDLGPTSINRFRALVRVILRRQRDDGHELGLDPARLKNSPEGARNRFFEPGEVQAIFDHLAAEIAATSSPRRRLSLQELETATRLAIFTAARRGELAKLRWSDVNLRGGTITFKDTKSADDRTVPIGPAAIQTLKRWRELRQGSAGDRVLLSQPHALSKRFTREAAAAGVVDGHFHDLRRTAATRMLEQTGDVRTVQDLTGHRTREVLLRAYDRPKAAHRREAVASLEETFGGVS